MAAYEANIIEIAAKKLHEKGEGLQSLVLHYEKADFLEWLRNNITLDEVIQAFFKHACLVNGVKLTDYNKYFSNNNTEVLCFILQESVLRSIMGVFTTGESPKDSPVYKMLQENFNFGPESANEIISIVGSVLNRKYEPRSIAVKEYNHFFKKAENDFLETRNALCYNIAQKEIDRLQTELTGSISDDLKYCLKILVSAIELIHYDLLPSLWNQDIHFTIEGGALQKNTLPSVLYNYYSTLKDLVNLANRSQDPVQYKAVFIYKIAPFFEMLQKEGNSFFTKNLNHHYQWHLLKLSVLLDLPKLIHKANLVRPQNCKEETQPPTGPLASPPPATENFAETKVDNTSQPASLSTLETDAIQSQSIDLHSASSEKADGKAELLSHPEITSQIPPRSSSFSHYEVRRRSTVLSVPSPTSITVYEPRIFADEKNANKQLHAILLEVIIQRIHSTPEPGEQPGIRSSLFHRRYLSRSQEFSNENLLLRKWLLNPDANPDSRTIYDDFNAALQENIAKSLPECTDMDDFKYFNIQVIHYFLEDPMHSVIALYAATNKLLTHKYSTLDEATHCIDSFCSSFDLDRDTFKNYEILSHLLANELERRTSSSNTPDSFLITAPLRQESAQLTEDEIKRFSACKDVVRKINEKRIAREDLELNIREFCEKNSIKKEVLMHYARQALQKKDISAELGSLHAYVQLAKQVLTLDKEIHDYDEAIKSVKALQYINKYEHMIQCLLNIRSFWMNYRDATRVIALYGHGLINPYLFHITFENYQELVEKEENSFSQIKHEVYYGVAEKELAERERASSTLSLIDIKLHMEYIVTVIELAPYDGNFSCFEKITYTFNGQLQEKCIPSALYRYHEELKKLIEQATIAHDQASYLQELNTKIAIFQSELMDESIHYMWHSKCLTHLYIMATALLEKSIDKLSSQSGEPSPGQKPFSSSSSSFQYEDQRRSKIQNGSLESRGADPQSTPESAKWNAMPR